MTPWTLALQAPLSMEFPRQEYWSGLPLSSPENLPDPGTESRSLALQVDSLPTEPPGKLNLWHECKGPLDSLPHKSIFSWSPSLYLFALGLQIFLDLHWATRLHLRFHLCSFCHLLSLWVLLLFSKNSFSSSTCFFFFFFYSKSSYFFLRIASEISLREKCLRILC